VFTSKSPAAGDEDRLALTTPMLSLPLRGGHLQHCRRDYADAIRYLVKEGMK
jgi:hypothetical protein